mgnify:CR=1 FL=1
MEKQVRIGIGVMIKKGNKILLGHRVNKAVDTGGIYEPDSWCLPGGKQDYDETIFECAIREVKEETNLNISRLEVFGAMDDIQPDRHFVTIQVIANNYSGEVKVMEEDKQDDWQWFDLNNLPTNLYSPSRKFIEEYKRKVK